MKTLAVLMLGVLIIGFAVWWKVSVWNECSEAGNSFMYCWQVISK